MLLCNKWEDLDAAENEATSFLSFFVDRKFLMLLWNSSCEIFVWTERFFVDLVVAGNFHGLLGLELEIFEWFLLLLV